MQPGGWVFNVLAFMESGNIHDMGKGQPDAAKRAAMAQRDATPIGTFNCPSRRLPIPYPNDLNFTSRNGVFSAVHARTDYAGNAGTMRDVESLCGGGPDSIEQLETGRIRMPIHSCFTGVSHCVSEIRLAEVSDGLSKTYAVGERSIDPNHYATGVLHSNDWPMFMGVQDDVYRSAYYNPTSNTGYVPLPDTPGVQLDQYYGSAHAAGCFFALCDGSVQFVSYDVEPIVHWQFANRADEGAVPDLSVIRETCAKEPIGG
jgi:hypothetical protein